MYCLTSRIVLLAYERQSPNDGEGAFCGHCDTRVNIWLGNMVAIPRIPFASGGKRDNLNCIVVCPKCYSELGEGNRTIEFSELPHYRVRKIGKNSF